MGHKKTVINMARAARRLYFLLLTLIVISTGIYLTIRGLSYYQINLEERFFHSDHEVLKPSGLLGHGLGIIGTIFILLGVSGYMARKRYRFMRSWGLLKYWLEFHIFLCTLGTLMILFHTAFKFGGIVSVSFWSMVAVFLSGIVGRFIYLQIPRTIEGRELSLNEVKNMRVEVSESTREVAGIDENLKNKLTEMMKIAQSTNTGEGFLSAYFSDRKVLRKANQLTKEKGYTLIERRSIRKLMASELSLNHRIARLQRMQKLFNYWHVAHMPFALVMLVIMVIHVAVTILFGFKWIF